MTVQTSYGHVYDRQAICESLLAQPNLDPLSNTRYTVPLAYVPCRMRQAYLKRKNLYQAYDDTYFRTDYRRAWNRLALRQENQALRAPENNNARGNNIARQPHAPEQIQVLLRELAELDFRVEAQRLQTFQLQDEIRQQFQYLQARVQLQLQIRQRAQDRRV